MKEWKAPEKEAQKMTRDGAVSVNLVTGEMCLTVCMRKAVKMRLSQI